MKQFYNLGTWQILMAGSCDIVQFSISVHSSCSTVTTHSSTQVIGKFSIKILQYMYFPEFMYRSRLKPQTLEVIYEANIIRFAVVCNALYTTLNLMIFGSYLWLEQTV